ncbi:MAG: hypothetical protein KJ888_20760, partial [Gammaproteobacteria bacterium]|nr:hypothetical protein [Gammaproteobacteria bacterium]
MKYGKDDEDTIRNFWVRQQPENRFSRTDANEFIFANLNPVTREIIKPAFSNTVRNILTKYDPANNVNIDLKTGKVLSTYMPMSYANWDGEVDKVPVARLRVNDILTVTPSGFGFPANLAVNENTLMEFNIMGARTNKTAKDGTPMVFVLAAIKGGSSPTLFFARAKKEHIIIGKYDELWNAYWEKEKTSGNLGNEEEASIHTKNFNEFAKRLTIGKATGEIPEKGYVRNKFGRAQVIALHEFMKAKRYPEYLVGNSAQVIFKRMSIDFGEGLIPVGITNNGKNKYTIKVFNPHKVTLKYNGKKVPMIGEVAGLKDKYFFDGVIFTSGSILDRTAKFLGKTYKHGLDELKTSIRNKDKEGNYVAIKGMEMAQEEGLEFFDGDKLIAKTILDEKTNLVNIVDSDGNIIDFLVTPEEAKNVAGKFEMGDAASTELLTMNEKSRRVIIATQENSKRSVAFPQAWIDVMADSQYDGLRSLLEKHMASIYSEHMKALFEMRKNPNVLRKFLQAYYAEGNRLPRQIDLMIRPDGKNFIRTGHFLPHIMNVVIGSLTNSMIKDRGLKGRRENQGTLLNLKPDVTGQIKTAKDIHISAKNTTVLKKLKQISGLNTVDEINEYLKTNEVNVLTSRFPVNDIHAVQVRRITQLRKGFHGESIFFNPLDVFGRLQADFDGDHISIEFLPDEISSEIK